VKRGKGGGEKKRGERRSEDAPVRIEPLSYDGEKRGKEKKGGRGGKKEE